MSKESFFIGEPVWFEADVYIYPPKVKDVVSNADYGNFTRILTYSQEEIEDIYAKEKKDMSQILTPLEFLLNNCYNNKQYEALCHAAFEFFLKREVSFLYELKAIVVGDIQAILEEKNLNQQILVLSEKNFFDFQNLIRLAINQKVVERPNPNEHPRIRAMKAKARYRDKVKAKQNAKKGLRLFHAMASICCMGVGITPLNIGEMSYVAMEALLNQFQAKEKYEIDIESLLAGADSKKIKPNYWIRNLEE